MRPTPRPKVVASASVLSPSTRRWYRSPVTLAPDPWTEPLPAPKPVAGPRPMPLWVAPILAVLLFAALRLGAPTPRALTADEVDTLEAGVVLVEHLTAENPEAPGTLARLRKGFVGASDSPRAAALPEDQADRRVVVDAPVPRWLAALGVGVLPASADATNLERAANASALAVALAAALLAFSRRRDGWLAALTPAAVLVFIPSVQDGAASAGYVAAGVLVMALWDSAFRWTARTGAHAWLSGVCFGLALGVHPGALFLLIALYAAWAMARRTPQAPLSPASDDHGLLALPRVPFALLAAPILGIATLIGIWPTLWSQTGKRLAAWLLDFGTVGGPAQDVAGVLFHPDATRSPQAWTALLQWVAWTPLPFVALFAVGAWHIARRPSPRGQRGTPESFALAAWGALMLFGALDGGLFGGRESLLALLWVPTAVVAAVGLVAIAHALAARLRGPRVLALVVAIWILPIAQALTRSDLDLPLATGAEARFPVPIALLATVAERDPGARVRFIVPQKRARGRNDAGANPDLDAALDSARDHLELPIHASGGKDRSGWALVAAATDDGSPDAPTPPDGATEIARDDASGVAWVLYQGGQRSGPGARSGQSGETRSK